MNCACFRYGLFNRICNALMIFCVCVASSVRAEPKTIVAFGDSLTQGYGLPADLGFVPKMGYWLGAQGVSVHMVNAGVSGDTTAGGLARLDWTLAETADLVIVNLGSNDMLRGLDPRLTYDNLQKIMAKLHSKNIQTLLIGHLAPLNYGKDTKKTMIKCSNRLPQKTILSFIPTSLRHLWQSVRWFLICNYIFRLMDCIRMRQGWRPWFLI